jgi:8-hydroxy-5-deazaflavin:NADPH oxidoreductase
MIEIPRCSSRRAFLRLAGGLALAAAVPHAAFAQPAARAARKIGVVGAGKIGGGVGGRWIKAGHAVFFSSRHPEALQGLVQTLGRRAQAGSVEDAIAFGEVLLVAVPYAALPALGRENAAGLAGKIVLDACNPIAARDGDIVKEAMADGIGPTSQRYLPGTRLVRVFDSVGYRNFEGDAPPAQGGEPIGMPLAGDDPEAVRVASQLVRDTGLEPVVVPLARAMDFAPGTALFGKALPVSELRAKLGVVR